MNRNNKNKVHMNKIRMLNKFCFSHTSECTGCAYTNVIGSDGTCLLEKKVQNLDKKINN